jgi:hypothetical protein
MDDLIICEIFLIKPILIIVPEGVFYIIHIIFFHQKSNKHLYAFIIEIRLLMNIRSSNKNQGYFKCLSLNILIISKLHGPQYSFFPFAEEPKTLILCFSYKRMNSITGEHLNSFHHRLPLR